MKTTSNGTIRAAFIKRPSAARFSPWGLTLREAQTMDSLCKLGSTKAVATKLHLSDHTVAFYLKVISKKMKNSNPILRALQWYKWRQENPLPGSDAL